MAEALLPLNNTAARASLTQSGPRRTRALFPCTWRLARQQLRQQDDWCAQAHVRRGKRHSVGVCVAASLPPQSDGPSSSSGPGDGDERAGALDPSDGPAPSTTTLDLVRAYWRFQHPALSNMRFSVAVEEFANSAVLAYECGHNEADVARELTRLSPQQLAAMQGFDPSECLAMLCLVWVTLMLAPRTVRRWATAPAVSEATLAQWRGFVDMIVTGYFEKRMAWFPLDRLALELSAVQGAALPQHLVAERARVVFTVLERVYPQFAKD